MGLIHPVDLDAWARWQNAQRRPQRLAALLRGREQPQEATLIAYQRGTTPRVATAIEATSPTQLQSVLAPLDAFGDVDALILSAVPLTEAHLPAGDWSQLPGTEPWTLRADDVRVALGVGHYLPAGHALWACAQPRGVPFGVVQHGLVTPFFPPMPADAVLLAWGEADADYLRANRDDVTSRTVGSQLLWNAAHSPTAAEPGLPPVFLGQLHGAELSRAGMTWRTSAFCRATGALYRPHPAERDALSRATHAAWRRAGIRFEESGRPLHELPHPVVAAFSTGLLEAAARGQDAWAHYPRPPGWLEEFWERYRIHRWGDAPTPAPDQPEIEPVAAIAAWVKEHL